MIIKPLLARKQQKHRTLDYPQTTPPFPAAFRGRPVVDRGKCPEDCRHCIEACPASALSSGEKGLLWDLGRCLFCTDCREACPQQAICFSSEYRLAVSQRAHLLEQPGHLPALAQPLDEPRKRLFRRSLKLRQVSAGGCNACEADVNVLNTVVYDLARFGVQFVASPRHADGLLVTGPISRNMELALQKTYEALPSPKIVIAAGACAISGGLFADHPQVCGGLDRFFPVDLYIPGCPPHPLTTLDGILRLLQKIT
jgi:Ni,Fe-hydrogenase III small subunit/Pyruvate/2-oxoacid:ferredoxin oxidoreductase delta subunit